MGEKIFEIIKNNLKNPKLYIVILVMAVIVIIIFPYIDANFLLYNRVEKRITILQDFSEIDYEKIEGNVVLRDEYESILSEISKQKEGSLGSLFITKCSEKVKKYKFITGALIFLAVGVMCIFVKMEKWWHRIVGLLFLGVVGGIMGKVSVMIPTIVSPIFNYIFMTLIQIVLIGPLVTSVSQS